MTGPELEHKSLHWGTTVLATSPGSFVKKSVPWENHWWRAWGERVSGENLTEENGPGREVFRCDSFLPLPLMSNPTVCTVELLCLLPALYSHHHVPHSDLHPVSPSGSRSLTTTLPVPTLTCSASHGQEHQLDSWQPGLQSWFIHLAE